tara:strand:- start:7875 stop:8477 length:603 start_codon:yes stop_codon:yes gene_type:complete
MQDLPEVSRLLRAATDGDRTALDELVPRVYDELRGLARSCLAQENVATLAPTALVHEAWLRLARQDSLGAEHRSEFFRAASTVMRRILVDRARARRAQKRGDGLRPVALDEDAAVDATLAAFEERSTDLLALEDALERLEDRDPQKARLVELRFFAGLDMRSAAEALGVSLRQAERDWTVARAFLRDAVTSEAGNRGFSA